jgi:uncharacterized membrane protein
MGEKRSKYDTNPLDPDVVRRTDEIWGDAGAGGSSAKTEEMRGATREVARTRNEKARADEGSEAPTRRYDNPVMPASYPSVFVPPTYPPSQPYPGQQAPTVMSGAQHMSAGPPTSRTVPGIGVPENVTMILPYLPFPVIGGVIGLIELLLVPRAEWRTRFHAAQGLSLHILVVVVGMLFNFADKLPIGGPYSVIMGIASLFFTIATFIFFIISMVRVWKGEPHIIGPLSEATKWFNEKIGPSK